MNLMPILQTERCANLTKLTEGGKRRRKTENQFFQKRKISRKSGNNKLAVDDLHHVACFDLQTILPTAT